MGQSTAEMRRDIERTREEMSDTIDAIAERTSPGRALGRTRQRFAARFRSVRSQVMGSGQHAVGRTGDAMHNTRQGAEQLVESVREAPEQARQQVRAQTQGNPLAAGVIAFGAGLLTAYLVPSSSPERRVAKQLRQEAEPAVAELKEAGRELTDEVRSSAEQAARDVKDTATEAARQVAEDAKESADDVRQQASSGAEQVGEQARETTTDR
jgi:gas vesicle protein